MKKIMKEDSDYKKLMKYKREHPNMSEGPKDVAPIVTPKNDKEVKKDGSKRH